MDEKASKRKEVSERYEKNENDKVKDPWAKPKWRKFVWHQEQEAPFIP